MTFAEKYKLLGTRRSPRGGFGRHQQPPARSPSAAALIPPTRNAGPITATCAHSVNLDIFDQGTIFKYEGDFS